MIGWIEGPCETRLARDVAGRDREVVVIGVERVHVHKCRCAR